MRRAHKKAPLPWEPARSACEAAPSAPTERTIHGSPYRGAGSRRLTERLYQICSDLSVSAPPSHLPWKGRLGICAPQGFPYEGKLSPQATDEVDHSPRRKCSHLIRHGSAVPPSPHRGSLGCRQPCKKVQAKFVGLHLFCGLIFTHSIAIAVVFGSCFGALFGIESCRMPFSNFARISFGSRPSPT